MEVPKDTPTSAFVELDIGTSMESFQKFIESQKELFHSQIGQLEDILVTQCRLTGVNPLSQEMAVAMCLCLGDHPPPWVTVDYSAAGALAIKIGKRPRDLLNSKAVKYMQSVFSIKDTVTKKESREISALCGVTVTQVREFFAGHRSRVRKLVRLSREKAIQLNACNISQDGCFTSSDLAFALPIEPVPLKVDYSTVEEASSCPSQEETIPGINNYDKNVLVSIFRLMKKEETFSGQVKLLEWILQIQNSSVLYGFLTKGGLMILATWLSQAALEEQTTVLLVIFKLLCHVPLHKALPGHMSAILQTVNRLRFYRTSDISNRARLLLSRWSKLFVRSQAMKKPISMKSPSDVQREIIRKQRIGEILSNELWPSKVDIPEEILALTFEGSENCRKSEPSRTLKLLPASADDSNKKHNQSVASPQIKERRKVQLMEQPGKNTAGRSPQVARALPVSQGRPMSADDIQKAKMRAIFMQSKYGTIGSSSNESSLVETEGLNRFSASQTNNLLPACKTLVRLKIVEDKKSAILASKTSPTPPEAPKDPKLILDPQETSWETLKRDRIPWQPPPAGAAPVSAGSSYSVSKCAANLISRVSFNITNGEQGRNLGFTTYVGQSILIIICPRSAHTLSAEMRINYLWRVGAGEKSKEVEVQTERIRREKETIYQRSHDIPSNPKGPWDFEMNYDDTLTPEIPTEQLPDADVAETSSSPRDNQNTADTSSTNPVHIINASVAEPDLELLAVLLKNPELVFALTSAQGGSLTSAEMVKVLDMIKASGVILPGSFNATGGKGEEKMEMTSLPSPTPSDAIMNRWRPEVANDSFTPPVSVANRDPTSIPVVTSTVYMPEKLPTTSLARPQVSATNFALQQLQGLVNPSSQQHPATLHLQSSSQLHAAVLLEKKPPVAIPSVHPYSPPSLSQLQQLVQEAVIPEKHFPITSSLLQSFPAAVSPQLRPETASLGQMQIVRPAPVSIVLNTPKERPTIILPSCPTLLQTPARFQKPLLPDPMPIRPLHPTWPYNMSGTGKQSSMPVLSNRWRGSTLNPLSQAYSNNYNSYSQGTGQPSFLSGLPGEPELETWSPERNLVRSPDYRPGWNNYSESSRDSGRNSRAEWSRQRNSGGWDHRHGNKRWRDRRH